MKLYSIGTLGFIATVAGLVANVNIRESFHRTHPWLFYSAQITFVAMFLISVIYILSHWDKNGDVTKTRFFLSIISCSLIYYISYVPSALAYIVTLACGVSEIYVTRKRANLIRPYKKRTENKTYRD